MFFRHLVNKLFLMTQISNVTPFKLDGTSSGYTTTVHTKVKIENGNIYHNVQCTISIIDLIAIKKRQQQFERKMSKKTLVEALMNGMVFRALSAQHQLIEFSFTISTLVLFVLFFHFQRCYVYVYVDLFHLRCCVR